MKQRRAERKALMSSETDSLDDGEESFDDLEDLGDQDFQPTRNPYALQDALYEGEYGYSLVKFLRGKNVGRRLKRNFFKYSIILLLFGLAMFILAVLIGTN